MNAGSPEVLSPELVLVDPETAPFAREGLRAPGDTLDRILLQRHRRQEARAHESRPYRPAWLPSRHPDGTPDEAAAAALRRIVDLADVEPAVRRRRHRFPKVVGALATWTTVAIMAIETELYRLVLK